VGAWAEAGSQVLFTSAIGASLDTSLEAPACASFAAKWVVLVMGGDGGVSVFYKQLMTNEIMCVLLGTLGGGFGNASKNIRKPQALGQERSNCERENHYKVNFLTSCSQPRWA
jgi:hypothetical protein